MGDDDDVHQHEEGLINDFTFQVLKEKMRAYSVCLSREIDVTLTYIAGRQIPQHPRDQLLDLIVGRLPQQPDEGGHTAGAFNRSLVLVVLTAVRQISEIGGKYQMTSCPLFNCRSTIVPQSSTSITVDLGYVV